MWPYLFLPILPDRQAYVFVANNNNPKQVSRSYYTLLPVWIVGNR